LYISQFAAKSVAAANGALADRAMLNRSAETAALNWGRSIPNSIRQALAVLVDVQLMLDQVVVHALFLVIARGRGLREPNENVAHEMQVVESFFTRMSKGVKTVPSSL
jgi:hypothetical protein